MTKKTLVLGAMTGILALTMIARAEQPEQGKGMPGCMMMKSGGAGGDAMGDHCKAMMAKHEQVMTDMKAMDQKLDDMVAAMNTASGSKKTEAMAALVTEMVKQRKVMRDSMAEMQMADESHQREHLCMAMMASMGGGCSMMKGGSMAGCSMMMGNMAEKKDAAPAK